MNIVKKDNEWFILFIFLSAFLIRALYIFQVLHFPLTEYMVRSDTFDQYGFDTRASFIASGNWLGGNEVFAKEPLYSYFLAVIYKFFGYNHLAVYLIQAVLTSLGVVLLYRITEETFNKTAAYIASIIMAFYSLSIFYDAVLLRESLITFLNILLLYLFVKARRNNRSSMWFASGVVLGLSFVARHNVLLPFIVIYIFFALRPFKAAVKKTLVFLIGMSLVLLPVVLRNYVVSEHKTIRVSSDINAFWVGNVYDASGLEFDQGQVYQDMIRRTEGSIKKMAALFLAEVKNRPGEYAKLYARKIRMFFNGYEQPSNTNYYLYREEFPTVLRWPLFNFRLVCALGTIGLFLSFFGRRRPWLAYIFLGVLSIQVIMFHIQARYRLPAVPFFIMFCSYCAHHIFDRARKRQFIKSAVILAAVLFFYIITKPDYTYGGFNKKGREIRPIDRTNLALAYLDEYKNSADPSDLEGALRQSGLAAREDRRYSDAYRIKGYVYLLEQKYPAAIKQYKHAIIYENKNPFLYNELGGVYFERGDYGEAFIFIKRALRLFPGNKLFEKNLGMIPLDFLSHGK